MKIAISPDGGDSWLPENIKVLDSFPFSGQFPCLLAKGSDVYITYYVKNGAMLKRARSSNYGTHWATDIIDTDGPVGEFSSLAR